MKNMLWLLLVISQITLAQNFIAEYPTAPYRQMTPGQLCDHPDEYRYPERIAYCNRDVSVNQKDQIFAAYRRLGFRLSPSKRSSYKIDHYVPLCAGGSNNNINLWPQHIAVGAITDPIEQVACDKMAKGRVTQARAVQLILIAKNDTSKARAVLLELSRL